QHVLHFIKNKRNFCFSYRASTFLVKQVKKCTPFLQYLALEHRLQHSYCQSYCLTFVRSSLFVLVFLKFLQNLQTNNYQKAKGAQNGTNHSDEKNISILLFKKSMSLIE